MVWIILATIAALIAIFFLLPLDLVIHAESEKELRAWIRIGYLPIGKRRKKKAALPKESQKPAENKKKGAPSALKKFLYGSKAEKQSIAEALPAAVGQIKMIIEQIFRVFRHCRLQKCHLQFTGGGEDAPLDYGLACAVLYPLETYLADAANVRKRGMKTAISCSNDAEKSRYKLKLILRLRIFHGIGAGFRILKSILKKPIEEE